MKFTLIRADDQVHLEVETFNLEPQRAGAGYQLRPVTAGQPGHITVGFPKQQVMEYVGTIVAPNPKQIGPIFPAGTTRVVFFVPAGHPPIPFTVAGVLGALPGLALVTDGTAGTVGEAQDAGASLRASSTELVLDAMRTSPNGAAAGAPAGALLETASVAPDGAPNGASRGAAGHNGTPGAALLAELEARALARRQAPLEATAPAPVPVASSAAPAPGGGSVAVAAVPGDENGRAVAVAVAPGTVDRAVAEDGSAVPGAAVTDAQAASATPGTTFLGFPSKLYLSVAGGATRMAHAAQPVVNGGNVELWHSRLARRTVSGKLVELPTNIAAQRALISQPTADPALSDAKINSVLDTSVQNALAVQTSGSPGIPPVPGVPAVARRLWLSPLGAWLDARGSWPGRPVQGWRHRMVMGRDHYVQVVQRGRLYPLGHEAVLVSTMERTNPSRNGQVATLVRRDTIHVTQPERDFGAATDPAGRQWPWQTVELLTLESPAGVKKDVFPTSGNVPKASYLEVGGLPFRFDCLAVDRGHRVSTFDMPLLFVPLTFSDLAGLSGWFASPAAQGLGIRGIDLDGQVVALAPSGGGTPPDTTTVVALSAPLTVATGGPLGFRPALPSVQGVVPALSRFAAAGGAPQQVTLAAQYLTHGFDPTNNPGEALFAFAGPVVDLGKGSTGGMVAPSFNISGLSRKVGLVGGSLADVAAGKFDPQKALAGALDAIKLFGIFKLSDLLPSGLALGKDAPRMVTQSLDGLATQELKWSVPLFGGNPNGLEFKTALGRAILRRTTGPLLPGTSGANLLIHVQAQPVPGTQQVRTSALCQLTNLELVLEVGGEEIVTLPLPLFEFKSVDGDKPDVNVKLGRIAFGGVLAFVETLASLIDEEGFSDPPALDLLPNGVRSSFSAPIPAVAVGMFSLENITFGAELSLYFDAPLTLALNFATPESPFRLCVAALGGGGWLKVEVSSKELVSLEGALEFGASLSVNLGVARGSVSVMGGIAFFIEGSEAMLTGYLRVRGEVQVLGLISVCIESTLYLTYYSDSGKLEGACEWVLRVKVIFIRKTVKVRFEKRFAGANADPTFAELMAPAGTTGVLPWDRYCGAFAEA